MPETGGCSAASRARSVDSSRGFCAGTAHDHGQLLIDFGKVADHAFGPLLDQALENCPSDADAVGAQRQRLVYVRAGPDGAVREQLYVLTLTDDGEQFKLTRFFIDAVGAFA